MKKWIITYTVTGFGQFPIDMLRYDRSFPADQTQSSLITRTFHDAAGSWSIKLSLYGDNRSSGPNTARWKSFICAVKDVECRKL